jgi:type IV secretion system protein VirD4
MGLWFPGVALTAGSAWLTYALLRRFLGRRAARLYLMTLPLLALGIADFMFTPVLWLMPRTLLPPMPALTWPGVFRYLDTPAGRTSMGTPATQWWRLGVRLLRTRPEPGWIMTQVPFAAALYGILWWIVGGRRHGQLQAAATATHGSSRWRKPAELGATLQRTPTDRPAAAGVVVGSDGRAAHLTRPEVGNPHALLLGATRSGKSRRVILPMVWCLGHRKESMILTDPKGELHAHSGAWLRSQGYEVVQIDLLRPARGNRWNPLAGIVRAIEAGDAEEASRQAWEIGNVLAFSDHGHGADPIWPQAAESTIAALALGAALEAPEGARHPATMYRILADLGGDGEGGASLDEWFRSLPAGHPARLAYGTAALSESRTRSSIFTGTAANLRTFADPGVAWLTAESDHDPADAGRKPTAIFLLLPDEAGARRPIASLYVAQAYSALAAVAREAGGRVPVPVWFLLDEFGNVGKLPGIAEKLTVSAGRGIRFLLAVQSLAQIDHIYGPQVREIVTGNCDTTLFLRAADEATASAISRKAGTYTVRTQSLQRRAGATVGISGTEGATGRPLLTPDEVLRWPLGEALILQAGQYPARLPLADLSAWRAAAAAFRPADPAAVPPVTAPLTWCPWDGTRSDEGQTEGAATAGGTAGAAGTASDVQPPVTGVVLREGGEDDAHHKEVVPTDTEAGRVADPPPSGAKLGGAERSSAAPAGIPDAPPKQASRSAFDR